MKLGSILTYQKGKSAKGNVNSQQLVLYLTPEYLRGNSVPNFVSDFSDKIEVKDGDLLLLWDGSNAGEFFVGKSGVLSSTMVKLLFDKEEHNSKFLFYQLKAFESYLKSQTSGSGIPHVDRELLLGLEIRKFEKFEQIKIALVLSEVDDAILKAETLIAKKHRIKTGLMQDLLTKGIDAKGDIRNKGKHRFVWKNGIEVPEDWEVDTLGKYSNLHNNLRRPISALERFSRQGDYPYYGATGIIDSINDFRVEGRFVLIGEDGDHFLKFGSQEMTHLVDGKFNVSNHAHILSGRNGCLTDWIHYYFCHRDITLYLTRQGAGRFKLNKQSLNNLPICVPDEKEQLRIIAFMESFNKQLEVEIKNLSKFKSLKIGLMQDLLNGKVSVK